MKIPEYTIDGYGNKKIMESHHFMIQPVRIPTTEPMTLRKIIQLGLNSGQLQGSDHKKIQQTYLFFGPRISLYFPLSKYVYKSDIIHFSNQIPDSVFDNIIEYLAQF